MQNKSQIKLIIDFIYKKHPDEKVTSYGDLVRLNIKIVAKLYPVNNVLTTELFCIFLAKDMAKLVPRLRLVPGYRPKGDAKLPTEIINNTKGGIVSFSVKIKVSAIFF